MSSSKAEVINSSILYIEATAVYLQAITTFSLLESAGGTSVNGTLPQGVYTTTTFATALENALDNISPNNFNYTVTSSGFGYPPLPQITPTAFGSGFQVSFNGTGNFVLTFPSNV